jgi:hypothetical protein
MRLLVPCLVLLASCGGGDPPAPAPEPVEQAAPGGAAGEPAEAPPTPILVALPPRPDGPAFGDWAMLRDTELDGELPWEHAGTLEDPVPIDVDFLGAWEFDETRDPVFPPAILALDGRKVLIRGFMLPSVDFRDIREFHLVRSLWGCCFGAPPRLNEIVRVQLAEGVDYTYDGLELVGTLEVVYETEDGIAEDLYRLDVDVLRPIPAYEDPDAPMDFDPAAARGIILGKEQEF